VVPLLGLGEVGHDVVKLERRDLVEELDGGQLRDEGRAPERRRVLRHVLAVELVPAGWRAHDTRLESKQRVVSLTKATPRVPYLAFFSSSSMVRAVMMASVRARVFQGFTRSAPTKLPQKKTAHGSARCLDQANGRGW
jgi:hypothetical protein